MAKTDPKESVLPITNLKRQAFMTAADAIGTLEKRSDQVDVLRAVAAFFGLRVHVKHGDVR